MPANTEQKKLSLSNKWLVAMRRPHFWFIVAMLATGGFFQYGNVLSYLTKGLLPGLTVHSMERILFLLPVVYSGFFFGTRGGIFTLVIATLLMLPHAILFAPDAINALLESAAVIIVASLILLMFEGQYREKQHRHEIVASLEVARQELSAHIDLIKKNERELSAINDICKVVTQSLELPQTLQLILDKVLEVTGVEVAFIFLINTNNWHLELVAYRGVSREFADAIATLKIGEGLNGRVAESGQPMIVEDTLTDPRPVYQAKQEGLRSQLIVPLKSREATIGSLCIATHNLHSFLPEEMQLLTAIGSQVGIAIDNARLYREVRVSEENFRDLFENASIAIFVHNIEGIITAANKACSELTGYERRELIGMNVSKLRSPLTSKKVQEMEDRILMGDNVEQSFEMRLLKKDGTESIASLSTRLIIKDKHPQGFEHIARDVTEHSRMRESLDFYLRQILTAQEEERKRIARELHDETAQSLLLISQRLDSFITDSDIDLAPTSRKYLAEVRSVALQALADMRRLTQDLRPRVLDDLGLTAALEWLSDDLEKQCQIKSSFQLAGEKKKPAPEVQLCLFRIAQEALSNIRRHSGATFVKTLLEFEQNKIRLTIEDNGKGFKVPERLRDLANSGKLGLLGMQERTRLLGGTIKVMSEAGRGTTVISELPIQPV